MREQYESKSVTQLREIAKEMGLSHISAMRKADLINAIVAAASSQTPKKESASAEQKPEKSVTAKADTGIEAAQEAAKETAQEAVKEAAQETAPEKKRRVKAAGKRSEEAGRQAGEAKTAQGQTGRDGNGRGRTEAAKQKGRSTEGRQSARTDRAGQVQGQAGTAQRQSQSQGQQAAQNRQNERTDRSGQAQGQGVRQQRSGQNQGQQTAAGRQNARIDRSGQAQGQTMRSQRQSQDQNRQPRPQVSAQDAQQSQAQETLQTQGQMTVQEPGQPVQTSQPAAPVSAPVSRQSELAALDSGNTATGILEIIPEGYGFLRSENYLPGENDVYVAPSQIRKFNLKTGDVVTGNTRVKAQQEKYSALLYIQSINGFTPEAALRRHQFEDMTPVFPNERLRMERGTKDVAMRIVDLFSPVGKGQRGMIVSPPKAGKTTLLKEMATSILKNNPSMHIIIMLIDERPEEVTDIREAIVGENVEVLYSTFDELPEHHKRVSEMGIERAKRLVEYGQDVVILLDSITRLARAYNLTVVPSGRTLSGGLDPAALHMPKRFFGAARNMREGGSLTILATALVDTGSKMDDVVYEEFKGTGNMELVLDRKLSERRVFPAIDIQKSGTRREDLLLDGNEQEAVYYMRRALNGLRSDEAVESILNLFVHTRSNEELVSRIRMQRRV